MNNGKTTKCFPWLLLAALYLTGCAQPVVSMPSPGAVLSSVTVPVTVGPTLAPSPTAAPSATPTATPTADPTWIVETTLEAIRVGVVAGGIPEGSTEFDRRFQATRCAVAPPPTPTALPFAVEAAGAVRESANCLGGDLAGDSEPIWLDGRWLEADAVQFAHAEDLQAARQAYERYLDLISFRTAGPGGAFPSELAAYMDSADVLPSPQSCLAQDIAGAVTRLNSRGQYVRLTFTQGVEWGADYTLLRNASGLWQLALRWQAAGVLQELIDRASGETLAASRTLLAGTAWLMYLPERQGWIVTDDGNGYYCSSLSAFLN